MSDTMRGTLLFLIETLFNIYLFVLIIRVILSWVNADYYHPVTQFIVKCTNFLIKPLRNYIPNYRDIELSTLLAIFVLEVIKFLLLAFLTFGMPNIFGLIILVLGDMLKLFVLTFFYALLLQFIISWVQPNSPANLVLQKFNAPVLAPFQRIIPIIQGFDFSFIPAMIILQLINFVVISRIMALGLGIAFS